MKSRQTGPSAPVPRRVAAFLAPIPFAVLALARPAAAQPPAAPPAQEVVVSAARVAQPLPDALPSTTLITRADIEASPALDLPDLLRNFTSFNVGQTGPRGSQAGVFVRGANSNQVLVLVDGAPLIRADFGAAPWELVPLAQIDHVEIVRGNLSSLYGAQAVGGVVQIFTRHGAGTAIAVGGGSHGNLEGSASLGRAFGDAATPLVVSAGVSGTHDDAYSARDARVDPSANPDRDPVTQTAATLAFAKTWARGQHTSLSVMHSDTDARYDGYNGPTVADELKTSLDAFALHSQHALTDTLDLQLGAGETVDRYVDPTGYITRGTARTRRLDAALDWTVAPGQRLQAGVESALEHYGDSATPDTTRRTNAVRAGWLGTFAGGLELQANVRHDHAQDYGSANTGLLSVGWRFTPELKLIAQASTAFSEPSFSDLQYQAAPLKPERSRDLELGLHWQHAGWLARATLFSQRQHDLIAYDADFQTVNIEHASNRGLELLVDGDTGVGHLGLDATFQDARDDDAHTALLRRARTVATVNYRVPVADWELGAWLRYTGVRADGDPITFATVQARARTVLGLSATHRLSPAWTIGVKGDNLTGKRTPEVLGYTPPPPTVMVTLRGQWQ